MHIFVLTDSKREGPFTVEQVTNALTSGKFKPSQLAWHDGCADWIELGRMLGTAPVSGSSAPPPPPPPSTSQQATSAEPPQTTPASKSQVVAKPEMVKWIIFGVLAVLLGFMVLRLIPPAGPPSSEVERAINENLGERINGSGRLYDSYKITNKYAKKQVSGEKWYFYEYEAVCPVVGGPKTFSGTVKLTKRGSKWYVL